MWQGWEGNEMYFFYDNTGAPIAFWYFPDGGSRITGYYFTNQQGDVVRIEDPDGNVLASYSYDAWGKAYKSSGSMRNINPLRFRGYYYDTETGLLTTCKAATTTPLFPVSSTRTATPPPARVSWGTICSPTAVMTR